MAGCGSFLTDFLRQKRKIRSLTGLRIIAKGEEK
jgi:hypothetical protein